MMSLPQFVYWHQHFVFLFLFQPSLIHFKQEQKQKRKKQLHRNRNRKKRKETDTETKETENSGKKVKFIPQTEVSYCRSYTKKGLRFVSFRFFFNFYNLRFSLEYCQHRKGKKIKVFLSIRSVFFFLLLHVIKRGII